MPSELLGNIAKISVGLFKLSSLSCIESFNQPHNVPLVGFVRIVQSLENLHFFPANTSDIMTYTFIIPMNPRRISKVWTLRLSSSYRWSEWSLMPQVTPWKLLILWIVFPWFFVGKMQTRCHQRFTFSLGIFRFNHLRSPKDSPEKIRVANAAMLFFHVWCLPRLRKVRRLAKKTPTRNFHHTVLHGKFVHRPHFPWTVFVVFLGVF